MKHCSTQEPATNTVKKYFAAFLLTLLVPLLAAEADVADGVRAYDAGWYEDALAEFLPAAEAGDTQAQLALASMYQFGEGVWRRMTLRRPDGRVRRLKAAMRWRR